MKLFRGDWDILVGESFALASAFGERGAPSVYPKAHISVALIEQFRRYPEEFSSAFRSTDPHTALIREAVRLDMPFWTLAYGLSVPVATSFSAADERCMDALIRMGDLELGVIEALKEKLGVGVLPASRIYTNRENLNTSDWTSYDLRANLCSDTFATPEAYPFLLFGISPESLPRASQTRQHQRLLAAIVLGVPADYAVRTGGLADPQAALRAYREGIAPEYVSELY